MRGTERERERERVRERERQMALHPHNVSVVTQVFVTSICGTYFFFFFFSCFCDIIFFCVRGLFFDHPFGFFQTLAMVGRALGAVSKQK